MEKTHVKIVLTLTDDDGTVTERVLETPESALTTSVEIERGVVRTACNEDGVLSLAHYHHATSGTTRVVVEWYDPESDARISQPQRLWENA